MALKTKLVQIGPEGLRDAAKVFLLTEMPAMQAEWWAQRVFLAAMRGGAEIPEDVYSTGLAGLTIVGLTSLARTNPDDAKPLLDEMLGCVQCMPDPKIPEVVRPLLAVGDVEEVATLFRLRAEVFELHTGFSFADVLSMLNQATTPPAKD